MKSLAKLDCPKFKRCGSMRVLFRAAFRHRRVYSLFVITLLSMTALVMANGLERFALGFMTQRGADAFQLFAPGKEESSNGFINMDIDETISLKQIKERWPKIDINKKGYITKQEALQYLSKQNRSNFLLHLINQVDKKLGISKDMLRLIFLLAAVGLIKAMAQFAQTYTTSLMGIRVSQEMRQSYFDHIQTLPMSFYDDYNIGSLSVRVSGDAGVVAEAINSLLTNYFQAPVTIFSTMWVLYKVSPSLFSMVFCALPLLVIPVVILTRRVKRVTKQMRVRQEQFASVLYEFLAGIQTIKTFTMEALSSDRYRKHNDQVVKLEEKSTRYGLLLRPILHFLGTSVLAFVILYGFYYANMQLSEILVFCLFLYSIYEPVKKFADENTRIQQGVVSAERIEEVLNIKPHIADSEDAIELEGFNHTIEFKDVWFRYNRRIDEWVLKGFDLTINKGEFVAFVGSTGAGKSTIVQLLLRLYEVERGSILIDGVDIRKYTQRSLRQCISFVPQKPFLFLDTIASNVAFGNEFDLDRVKQVAEIAHAAEFIDHLPQKYDTPLLELGKDLSGGQQQRLAIARALYKQAPILVLDEATASLDAITEDRIKSVLQELQGEMTQLVIAHRLSTIENADRIVYLEGGVKVEEGNRQHMLKHCPGFKSMWETMIEGKLRKDYPE